jgi:hypothetical protein
MIPNANSLNAKGTPALHQQFPPDRFLNAINAYQLPEAIKSSIELSRAPDRGRATRGHRLGEGALEPENPDGVKFAQGHDAHDAETLRDYGG